MVNPSHDSLSIVRQCQILRISRSGWYYESKGESALNLQLMRLIDEQHLKTPYYGSRQMTRHLRRNGFSLSRKRVQRLMRFVGIRAVYQAPKTSISNPQHKIYPYLLKDLDINRPNQVWSTDITYIPVKRGFLYLVAIMDWHSRKVLSWRLSNTMDSDFCVDALKEALLVYGKPEIFNTDQGSQFTSVAFTSVLQENGIKISMDGKGRWVDNVFIERLWRSLKYECVYLQSFENGKEARTAISEWLQHYNVSRPHSTFNGQTPSEVYHKIFASTGLAQSDWKLAA